MTERHYNEDEVAEIFRAAAEGPTSNALPTTTAKGLTLRDLQAIALEVDIPPDAVARAAQSLDSARTPEVAQTFLGLPIAVERSAMLPRRLTDTEWDVLVTELRRVFGARGRVRAEGSLREWNNGNLRAALEPTPTGQRLRLSTFKGNARASVGFGALALVASAALGVMSAINGMMATAGLEIAALATVGVALIATGPLRLPTWARQRRQQMDSVVERLIASTQGQPHRESFDL